MHYSDPGRYQRVFSIRFKAQFPLNSFTYRQFLFGFKSSHNQASQLMWTVHPQGFRDIPHFFGQELSHKLGCFKFSEITVLKYVDKLLLCTPTEDLSSQGTHFPLNFVVDRSYKIYRSKHNFAALR